jgi:hypothetical protein
MRITTPDALRNPSRVMQLDLFREAQPEPALPPPSSASPIVGLVVEIPDRPPCACGSRLLVINSSNGPHSNRLDCRQCGKYRAWLSHETAHAIEQTVEHFGRPTEPIVIRRRREGAPS